VAPARYVDVNIFVYWLGGHPDYGDRALKWIERMESSPRGEYITSVLTLYEVLVVLGGLANRDLEDLGFVEEILEALMGIKGLVIAPFTMDEVEEAEKMMREYGLDFEDALHLATALKYNVREIISNDRDFDGLPINRIF